MKKSVNVLLIGIASVGLNACTVNDVATYQTDYSSSGGYVTTYHSNKVTSGYNRNYQSSTAQQQTTYSNTQSQSGAYSSSNTYQQQQSAPSRTITTNQSVPTPPEAMSPSGYNSSYSSGMQ